MIEKSLLAFWAVWVFLLLLAAFRVFGFSIARRHQDRRFRGGSGPQKSVALIVPVKGFDLQATPRFFDSIFGQSYRDYRVIVCFESWEDPVAKWLCEHLELDAHHPVWTHSDPESGLKSVTLVCGGLAETEGQKVHNQRAAFADLTAADAILAFADADILCGTDWLARLVAPINRGKYELSTTYRWLVPKRPTLPNQLACVINASITTQGGAAWSTVLWGGSMAVTREVFAELDVPTLLAGSLNDDLRLSKAARARGKKIAFVRSLILPTPVDFSWRTFFEFVRRQYTQVKFFSPILYTGVNLVLAIYMLGLVSIVGAIIYGYFFAWIPVAAAYVIDQFRALVRQQVYLSLFPDNATRLKLFATSWLEHMLTPFWMSLHWILLASTWTQNRITWGGIRYRIFSKSKTRVLGRVSLPTTLPAGAPGLAMIGALHDLRRGSMTQPIHPVRVPTEPIATFTMADEGPDLVVTEAPAPETVAAGTPDMAPVVTIASEPPEVAPSTRSEEVSPISLPPAPLSVVAGVPSAIVPLSRAIPRQYHTPLSTQSTSTTRRLRTRGPRSRESVSAAAAARRKPRRIPVAPPVIVRPIPAPAPLASPKAVSPLSRGPLSAAERRLCKTRRHPIRPPRVAAKPPHRPCPSCRNESAALARLAARTRLLPPKAPIQLVAAPAPQSVIPPIRTSPGTSPTTSVAARRAGPGAPFRFALAAERPAALSSRTHPAARRHGSLVARPHARSASSRP